MCKSKSAELPKQEIALIAVIQKQEKIGNPSRCGKSAVRVAVAFVRLDGNAGYIVLEALGLFAHGRQLQLID